MDKLNEAQHVVYKKDSAGSTWAVGEFVYQNKILQHAPAFASLDKVLRDLGDFRPRTDDVWVLDFIKSGTHWMVCILELLLYGQMKSALRDSGQIMLEITPGIQALEEMPSPRILNSHMTLDYLPDRLFKDSKAIFMVRNPKSVAVSYYHHMKDLPFYQYDGTFTGFLPTFLEGHDYYGNWFDYVTSTWEAFKNNPNVLFVFFEELKKDPTKGITEVSNFMGLSHGKSFIEEVALKTSMENMTKAQHEMAGDKAHIIAPFFRKGTVADWKSHFTVAQNEMFDAVYEEKMKDYPDLKERIKFA